MRTPAERSCATRVRALKQRNILMIGSEGLGLQKNYDEWRPRVRSKSDPVSSGPGPNQTGSESDPKTESKSDLVTGSKSDPHKTRKQENKNTEAAASAHQSILRGYDRLFAARVNVRPMIV